MPLFVPPQTLPVSCIIPCGEGPNALMPLLSALSIGTFWPSQVLVVDAGRRLTHFSPELESFSTLVRVLECKTPLFPGEARNLGLQSASMNWIAFLDLNTLPPPNWLETIYCLAQKHTGVELVSGSTLYLGQSWQQSLFITASYGEQPLLTLPGSLVHRSVFTRTGKFLPAIRAGEDTDWLVRVRQFGIYQVPAPQVPLTYAAVPSSLADLVRKWFRNYRSCAPVVFHLEAHKLVYFLFGNLLLLFIAFNWNSLVADWRESSFLYVANITKIILAAIAFLYLLGRGCVMPLRRGSQVGLLLPLRWLLVGLICALLDITKLLAFVSARCDQFLGNSRL